MHALSSTVIVFGLCDMALACAALYLLPVLIGWIRHVPDIGSGAVINVLLGWTLAGWAAALAMALRSSRPAPPAVQAGQHLPQAQPRPDQARAGWAGPPGPPPPPAAGAGWAQRFGPPALRPGSPPPLVIPPRRPAGH